MDEITESCRVEKLVEEIPLTNSELSDRELVLKIRGLNGDLHDKLSLIEDDSIRLRSLLGVVKMAIDLAKNKAKRCRKEGRNGIVRHDGKTFLFEREQDEEIFNIASNIFFALEESSKRESIKVLAEYNFQEQSFFLRLFHSNNSFKICPFFSKFWETYAE